MLTKAISIQKEVTRMINYAYIVDMWSTTQCQMKSLPEEINRIGCDCHQFSYFGIVSVSYLYVVYHCTT